MQVGVRRRGFCILHSWVGLILLRSCGHATYLLSPRLYLTVLCLLRRNLALCGFLHRGVVYIILAPGTAPHTSLATFVRCPSQVRGVTCNILVWLPPYPHFFVFCVLRRRRTPYASGRAGAGVLHVCMHGLILAVCLYRVAVCNILALSLPTSYRVVLATALFSVAWHITYLCFGRPWRCCCLCVCCIRLLSCVLLRACVPFLCLVGVRTSP